MYDWLRMRSARAVGKEAQAPAVEQDQDLQPRRRQRDQFGDVTHTRDAVSMRSSMPSQVLRCPNHAKVQGRPNSDAAHLKHGGQPGLFGESVVGAARCASKLPDAVREGTRKVLFIKFHFCAKSWSYLRESRSWKLMDVSLVPNDGTLPGAAPALTLCAPDSVRAPARQRHAHLLL